MNTKPSTHPTWLIWSITLLGISSAFIVFVIYSPANTDSNNLIAQDKPIAINKNSDLNKDSEIWNMQQKIILQLITIKKQSRESMKEILLIKEAQELMQENINKQDNLHEDTLTENLTEKKEEIQESEETMLAQQQEYVQSIDDFFVSQNEDSIWTNQVTNDFETVFESHSDQLVLHDISCGNSICKLNASINTDQLEMSEPVQLDRLINGEAKWSGQSFYQMDTETGDV
ncbi:hypothetical protein MNBD_GAMMA07-413, partial [hydrothermal vent metagenome]